MSHIERIPRDPEREWPTHMLADAEPVEVRESDRIHWPAVGAMAVVIVILLSFFVAWWRLP